jgi:hypothetical protein
VKHGVRARRRSSSSDCDAIFFWGVCACVGERSGRSGGRHRCVRGGDRLLALSAQRRTCWGGLVGDGEWYGYSALSEEDYEKVSELC